MENLKKLRLEKGLSQQALGECLDIGQQSVYKYENQITEPNIDMLKNIADYFDVSVDYLIGHSLCRHKVESTTETALNENELEFIRQYRILPNTSKKIFLELIKEFNSTIE